jgi:hypothetical protein
MELHQAKGYILEDVIQGLLKESGYFQVESGFVRGRGARHQIDAYGVLSIPTAFIYPIRLFSEAKYYDHEVGLPTIRNFVGVIKDISENYFVTSKKEYSSPFRYTDAGCIFSASMFTDNAQKYAWAHNIFLFSFSDLPLMDGIINSINSYVATFSKDFLENYKNDKTNRKKLKASFIRYTKTLKNFEYPTMVVGILDNIYPVLLIGSKGWINRIKPPETTDKLDAEKQFRVDILSKENNPEEHIFKIVIKDGQEETIFFSIPNFAAKKVLDRIDNRKKIIADLQIPFLDRTAGKQVRRIISLDIKMKLHVGINQ